jgi:hypothetical protein
MKNLMMSLLLLMIAATVVNANTINSLKKEIPSPIQSNIDNFSTGTDTLSTNGPIGIADNKNTSLELMLYPNPVSTNLSVRLKSNTTMNPEPVYLYVIDMSGKILMEQKLKSFAGNYYQFDLNVRILPKNNYIIKIVRNGYTEIKKFQVCK